MQLGHKGIHLTKGGGSRNLRPSNVYTVEFRQPIHKNFEDILDNNKQYIKLYKLSQDYY